MCASQASPVLRAQSTDAQQTSAPFFDPKLFHPPIPTKTPEAELPDQARREGRSGRCALSVVVGIDGEPKVFHLIRCTDQIFASAALEAVKSYRFKPATTIQGNQPVAVTLAIETNFSMGSPGSAATLIPPARIRVEFVMPPGAASVGPDSTGVFTLSAAFGPNENFPKLKKFHNGAFAAAAFLHEDGVGCTLSVSVDQNGKLRDTKVVSCDRPGLEHSALDTISKSQFTPAIFNGKPVPVHAVVHLVCDGF